MQDDVGKWDHETFQLSVNFLAFIHNFVVQKRQLRLKCDEHTAIIRLVSHLVRYSVCV